MSEKYNGWTNYETWAVNLHITNDQGDDEYWHERAESCLDETDEEDDKETQIDKASYALAQAMKDEFEENNPLAGQCTFYADLLGAAINEVNFDEITRYFIEEAAE